MDILNTTCNFFFTSLFSLCNSNYYLSIFQQFGAEYTPKNAETQWKFQIGKLKKYEDNRKSTGRGRMHKPHFYDRLKDITGDSHAIIPQNVFQSNLEPLPIQSSTAPSTSGQQHVTYDDHDRPLPPPYISSSVQHNVYERPQPPPYPGSVVAPMDDLPEIIATRSSEDLLSESVSLALHNPNHSVVNLSTETIVTSSRQVVNSPITRTELFRTSATKRPTSLQLVGLQG